MKILIDSDLVNLMKSDSYISDFIYCEVDKVNDLKENYVPVNIYFRNYGLSIISLFTNDSKSEVHIRLVI